MKKRYEANVDPKSKDSLLQFFKEHYDYTTFELCCKYGIPVSTLNYWRRKVGMSKKPCKIFSKYNKKPHNIQTIDDPRIWDNGPWFKKMYVDKQIGAHIIAKMINRSVTVVYRRLNRFRIKLRDHSTAVAPKSKYYDKQWLWENYIKYHRPLSDIAKEVGVNPYTICGWIAKFGIPIRDRSTYTVIKRRRDRVKAYYEKHGASIPKTKI